MFHLRCEPARFITDGSIFGSWDCFSQHHISPCLIIFLRLPNWRDAALPQDRGCSAQFGQDQPSKPQCWGSGVNIGHRALQSHHMLSYNVWWTLIAANALKPDSKQQSRSTHKYKINVDISHFHHSRKASSAPKCLHIALCPDGVHILSQVFWRWNERRWGRCGLTDHMHVPILWLWLSL